MSAAHYDELTRREVVKLTAGGVALSMLGPLAPIAEAGRPTTSDIFSVRAIPNQPFRKKLLGPNHHLGVDCLLYLMAAGGLKFYRSRKKDPLAGRKGMIAADDIVLIKVNAQWKYRGCTNSDVIRGLIQILLDHPDGFTGEVVIIENGQGYGSLECAATTRYRDGSVHANANRSHHSFTYVVDNLIADSRVSYYLLDPLNASFIESSDHSTDGYKLLEDVSYPCFTTARGNRVELKEGIWTGSGYTQNLKLLNVPVLKHHDRGGSEITASLKHVYGILSMPSGGELFDYRHYSGLGETCGKMMVSVRTPVLNIIDAIWVSHLALSGFPEVTTTRVNRLAASQDPVALDYWAAKDILYPIDENPRHHPDFEGIKAWLEPAR
ncbi:MAG: DUF362 domain-containing protein, partial [bacterium]|nr:DUF362 domain-containing protein [bacterium]